MTSASVLVAPDKFKGSLTSLEVAGAIAAGIEEGAGALVRVDCLPLADGGDGSVAAAVTAGYAPISLTVPGPTGVPVQATIAHKSGTVVVEVANTCGLQLLPGGRLQPLTSSTRGLGVALRRALALKPQRIVLALGGSASTDGGLGMLAELGATVRPRTEGPLCGADLNTVESVDLGTLRPLADVELVLATDVTNPLLGPQGAAPVFAPQKGADGATVALLERGLVNLVAAVSGVGAAAESMADTPGAGSAGGLGFAGLLLGGRVVSGADFFLDLLDFDALVADRDLVVSGEGRLDAQSLSGKLPTAVAKRANGARVELVVGRSELTLEELSIQGVRAVHDISTMTTADTTKDAVLTLDLLRTIGRNLARQLVEPTSTTA